MGRKKKKIAKEPAAAITKQPSKISKVQVDGTQNFGYQGKIVVKIQHGNKIIKTTQYHNKGMPSLFKFLCQALAGRYSDLSRPCKIKLFFFPNAEGETSVTPENFDWYTEFNAPVAPRSASPFIQYETTPVLERQYNPDSYQVTFHFRIPFAMINDNIIHMVGFYPNNVFPGNEIDASAYYLFVDEKDPKNKWAPLKLDNITGNFSIIIDWTMKVMNKPEIAKL